MVFAKFDNKHNFKLFCEFVQLRNNRGVHRFNSLYYAPITVLDAA